LRAHNVPCGRVQSIADAIEEPQLRAREMIVDFDLPGLGPVRNIGNPIKLSRTPYELTTPAPALGQHTAEVLKALGHAHEPLEKSI
jgi:CoA:oxalate CoA-transferase